MLGEVEALRPYALLATCGQFRTFFYLGEALFYAINIQQP